MTEYTLNDELPRQSYFHEALGDMRTSDFDNDLNFELANHGNIGTAHMRIFDNNEATVSPQELTNLDVFPGFDYRNLSVSSSLSSNPNDVLAFQDNQQFAPDPFSHGLLYQSAVSNPTQPTRKASYIPDPQDVPPLAHSPESNNFSSVSNPATPEQAVSQVFPGKKAGMVEQESRNLQEIEELGQPKKKLAAKTRDATTSAARGSKRKIHEAEIEEDARDTDPNKPLGKRGRKARVFKDNIERQKVRGQFLERNRNAASKCREKKKQHTNELQQRYSYLSNMNGEMILELDGLRMELMALTQLMKQHTSTCGNIDPRPTIQNSEKMLWDVGLALADMAQARESDQPVRECDGLDADHGGK